MVDTKEILYCPACNSEMQKINLMELELNIDVCTNGCGGMYFDNRELGKVYQNENSIELLNGILADREFMAIDEHACRVCPVCGTNMVKMGGDSGVEYDACNNCGGKFLDNGELKKMQEFFVKKDDQFNKVLDSMYPQDVKFSVAHKFFVDFFTKEALK